MAHTNPPDKLVLDGFVELKMLQYVRRERIYVKSNMVYRLCNNMVYTFALGSFSKRYALLRV